VTVIRDHRKHVRDHRTPPSRGPQRHPNCNRRDISHCQQVRDHRKPPPIPCYGNLC
jgi:hypothetical protein